MTTMTPADSHTSAGTISASKLKPIKRQMFERSWQPFRHAFEVGQGNKKSRKVFHFVRRPRTTTTAPVATLTSPMKVKCDAAAATGFGGVRMTLGGPPRMVTNDIRLWQTSSEENLILWTIEEESGQLLPPTYSLWRLLNLD